ncbi:MAG: dUTP diphosphatase [Fimbriimonas sp.]
MRISLTEDATLPSYKTDGSAGLDLSCSETFELEPLQRKLIGTGIRIEVPQGFEAQVRPRSGLAINHGVTMVNSPGTIDSDYRGEVKLIMINLSQQVVSFKKGDRVAQLVICPVARVELQVVDSLDETGRGEGGFGSTGV